MNTRENFSGVHGFTRKTVILANMAVSMEIRGETWTEYAWIANLSMLSTQWLTNLAVFSFEIASDWKLSFIKLTFSFRLPRLPRL